MAPYLPFPRKSLIESMISSLSLISRDHQAVVLVEVLVQVLDELARAVGALDLAETEQVHLRQDLRLEQLDARTVSSTDQLSPSEKWNG